MTRPVVGHTSIAPEIAGVAAQAWIPERKGSFLALGPTKPSALATKHETAAQSQRAAGLPYCRSLNHY